MFTVYILDTHEVRDYIMSLYVYVIHAMFTVYILDIHEILEYIMSLFLCGIKITLCFKMIR